MRKTAQARLADQSGVSELEIAASVELAPRGGASHRVVMAVIQWTIVAVFLLGAATGCWRSVYTSFTFFSGRLRTGLPVAARSR